ncbi:hypothetical protein RYX36_008598 [Vicia faba]
MLDVKECLHDGGFKEDVPNLEQVIVKKGVAHFNDQEDTIEKNRGDKGGFGPLTSMGSERIENSFNDMGISSIGSGFGSGTGFGLTTNVNFFSTKPKGRFL